MRLITIGSVGWLIGAALFIQPTALNAEFTRLEDVWNTAHRNADAEAARTLGGRPRSRRPENAADVQSGSARFRPYRPHAVRTL